MRIGLLINDLSFLPNWKLRIISYIIARKDLYLVLVIKPLLVANDYDKYEQISPLTKKLFLVQKRIETILFKSGTSLDSDTLLSSLKHIEKVYLNEEGVENQDYFTNQEIAKIAQAQLDLILQFEFPKLRGALLDNLRYGVWSLRNQAYIINDRSYFGFREVVKKEEGIAVSLEKTTELGVDDMVIDNAFFNISWSYFKTRRTVLESSVSLVIRNLENIIRGQELTPKTNLDPEFRNGERITLAIYCHYIFGFYRHLLRLGLRKINAQLFGKRYDCWTLFIGKGDFLDAKLSEIEPVILPKNEFWADPFLLNYNEELYVFFENYEYDRELGKLSCAKIIDGKVQPARDVLIKKYHLSYPFIFKEEGQLYLMPETNENNRLEIYKCKNFPTEWELYTTAFNGERIVDSTIYTDKDGVKWLFLNKSSDVNVGFANELFIYRMDSFIDMKLVPHKQNPIHIDASLARNAGGIFERNGIVYRPSQANIQGVYGRALNINRIKTLTLEVYEEQLVKRIFPDFRKNLKAMHHLHQINDCFVFDASYDVN